MPENQNYLPQNVAGMLLAEMIAIKTMMQELKDSPSITDEWIPRSKVMEFFGYGDTQMGTLEKSGELMMAKIGNRKFYHRTSLLQLLQANVQGDGASTLQSSITQPSKRKHQ